MKQYLYLIHCGFYDEGVSRGVYEFHVNIPVAATSLEEAKKAVREVPEFRARKMHIDGIQEIRALPGLIVELVPANVAPEVKHHLYRDL